MYGFLAHLHSAFYLGYLEGRPATNDLFFFHFSLCDCYSMFKKWQFSCRKVMAECGKSPDDDDDDDDAVRPPGLRTVVTGSICQARRGVVEPDS